MLQPVGPRSETPTDASRARGSWASPDLAPLIVAGIAIALVVYFDLQSNLPYVDEYARRWTMQRLVDGHGLVFLGFSTNFAESVVALPAVLLHWEPRFWRLAGIPFMIMSGVFAFAIANRLGATRFWSAMAAALVIAGPVTLSLATGMMTETAYVGLLMAAAWFSIRWVVDGKTIGWVILLALLSTVQREQGVTIAPLITVGLLMTRRSRPIRRADVIGLVGVWLAVLVPYEVISLIQDAGPTIVSLKTGPSPNRFLEAVVAVTALPVLAGFFLLPFLVALLRRPPTNDNRESRWGGVIDVAPVIVGLTGVAWAALATSYGFDRYFVGNTWSQGGLGPTTIGGVKPAVLPFFVFLLVTALSLATTVVLLILRRSAWRPSTLGVGGSLLVIAALLQFVVVPIHGEVYDRYYMLVMAPLVPLLAVMASRSAAGTAAKAWAFGALTAGVLFFAVGEQDYQAWQTARDQTAQLAYASHAVDDVSAGFEEAALHLALPAMEDTSGSLPRHLRDHPSVSLVFARPDDPRPGFVYHSVASGKIVIQVDSASTP